MVSIRGAVPSLVYKLGKKAGKRGRLKIGFDEWSLRVWHHPGFPVITSVPVPPLRSRNSSIDGFMRMKTGQVDLFVAEIAIKSQLSPPPRRHTMRTSDSVATWPRTVVFGR